MEDNIHNLVKLGQIKQFSNCKNCPAKLFNKSGDIYLGFGNKSAKTMIIIPTHRIDKISQIENELREIFINHLNANLDQCYVTRNIKCNTDNKDIIKQSFPNCFKHLMFEMRMISACTIIVIGKEYDYITEYINSTFGCRYATTVPNPLVKNINENLYKQLIEQLLKNVVL